jgi:hypothetical protein
LGCGFNHPVSGSEFALVAVLRQAGRPYRLALGRDNVDSAAIKKIARNWKLLDEGTRLLLLRDVLPRLDLEANVMQPIASKERAGSGLTASAQEIAANPYLIAEMYCGADSNDRISRSTVDQRHDIYIG